MSKQAIALVKLTTEDRNLVLIKDADHTTVNGHVFCMECQVGSRSAERPRLPLWILGVSRESGVGGSIVSRRRFSASVVRWKVALPPVYPSNHSNFCGCWPRKRQRLREEVSRREEVGRGRRKRLSRRSRGGATRKEGRIKRVDSGGAARGVQQL